MPRCATSFSVRARCSAGSDPHHLERIGDVVERAQPWKQRLAIVLKNITELDLVEQHAVEQDLTGFRRDEAGDDVDQGAFAAAIRPKHRDQLTTRNIEIEIVVDDGLVEAL